MKRMQRLLCAGGLLLSIFTGAHAQEIKGDILWVNTGITSTIWFPEDVKDFEIGCDGMYSVKKEGRKVKVGPLVDASAAQPCMLRIEEGSRFHSFKIMFSSADASLDLEKTFIDVHSMDLLRQRVEMVEREKNGSRSDNSTPPPVQHDTQQMAQANDARQNAAAEAPTTSLPDYIDFDGIHITKSQMEHKVAEKLDVFRQNLQILGTNKSYPAKKVIDHILELFNNNTTRKVQVRNTGKPIVTRTIVEYLQAFSRLPYKQIKIEYNNLQFVGKFVKNPDGSYRGVVCLEQKFMGMHEGKPYYNTDRKTFDIEVRITELVKEGEIRRFVDVFLADIGIAENA